MSIQDLFEDVIDRDEHCVMYLNGKNEPQHIIELGKNYLNNWNKPEMEKMKDSKFEKKFIYQQRMLLKNTVNLWLLNLIRKDNIKELDLLPKLN